MKRSKGINVYVYSLFSLFYKGENYDAIMFVIVRVSAHDNVCTN